ncbi:MAG: formylglycine-generating enzyme family protein, partial [Pseudomonadota bacterium]
LLTGLVFVLLLPVGPMIGVMIQGGFTEGALEQGGFTEGALEQALAFGPSIWQFGLTLLEGRPFGEVEMVLAGEAAVSTTSLFIAFVTTFTTSVWLWLALLFAPLFRLMSWSRGAGLSMMGRLFNVRARPIAALGYLTAALIVTVGGAGAWAGKALRPAASGTFQDCAGCPEMIAIPGGTFVMGSPEDEEGRSEDEGPLREVTVSPFAMGVYEVTFREWDACVAEGFCACVDDGDTCKGGRPDDEGWGRGLRPAINVTKANVAGPEGFIDWLNSKVAGAPYRLPSEAEWEYAARAGAETRFWVGDMLTTDDANFNGKTRSGRPFYPAQTLPVGGPANAFGLHDVHGNVWEWVADCYAPSYEGAPSDGAARDADAAGGCESVSRGGSWGNSSMRYLRLADRGGVIRGHRLNPAIGFRVARTLDP